MFIGMGLGFLADSLLSVKKGEVRIEVPVKAGGLVMVVVGLVLALGGVLVIAAPEPLKAMVSYFVGVGLIAVGAYVLLAGVGALRLKVA